MNSAWAKLNNLWYDFFFKPSSPASFCLFRILFGLVVILSFLDCMSSAAALFGNDGMTSQALVHSMQRGYRLGLFFLLPPNTACILGAMVVLVIASLALTVGYKTRFNAFLVWFLLLSFRNRNPYVWNCGDDLIQIVSFLIMIGPSAAMYSLDAARQPNQIEKPECAPFTQRLVQIQLCIVYAVSFFCKTGNTWHDGTAVYYAMHINFYTHFIPPYLFDHLWTCKLFSWSTLAVEFSLFTLIWIRRCRPYVLLIGVCMHLSMLLLMNLHVLEFIILACYVNFIDAKTTERFINFFATRFSGRKKILLRASNRRVEHD